MTLRVRLPGLATSDAGLGFKGGFRYGWKGNAGGRGGVTKMEVR